MRGRVQIRYKYCGRLYSESLDLSWTDANIAQAARIRAERLKGLRLGLPHMKESCPRQSASKVLTFGEVAQELLNHSIATKDEDDPFRLKLSTRNGYRDLLNTYWQPTLGKLRIDSISTEHLRAAMRGVTWKSKRKANALGGFPSMGNGCHTGGDLVGCQFFVDGSDSPEVSHWVPKLPVTVAKELIARRQRYGSACPRGPLEYGVDVGYVQLEDDRTPTKRLG